MLRKRILIAGLVSALLAISCGSGASEGSQLLDASEVLHSTSYAVVGTYRDSEPARGGKAFVFEVERVVWTAETDYYEGRPRRFDAPRRGHELTAHALDDIDLNVQGRYVIIAAENPATQDGLADVKLILNEDWTVVDTYQRDVAAAVADLLEFAGRDDLEAVMVEVLDGAFSREEALYDPTIDDSRPTPGILGEWRRARGLEPVGPPGNAAQQALDRWLARPDQQRQLSDILDDLPPGADIALGVEWVWREAAVVIDSDLRERYEWIGLRFSGIGVIGPVHLDPDAPIQPILGWGPAAHVVQIVAWSGEEPEPSNADILGSAADWRVKPEGDVDEVALWVTPRQQGNRVFVDIEQLDREDFDARIMGYAPTE